MIVNINYKAITSQKAVAHLQFSNYKPQQYIWKGNGFKIIIFRSGSCRIMGCKKPIKEDEELPFDIRIDRLQSVTLCFNLEMKVNLSKLAEFDPQGCLYDPEIFPALRYIKYNPLCVNVFASGKVVILGIKTLDFQNIERIIMDDLMIISYDL